METKPSSAKAAHKRESSPSQALGDTAFVAGDSAVNEPKGGTEPKKLAHTEEFAMESNEQKAVLPAAGSGTDVPKSAETKDDSKGEALNQTAAFDQPPPAPPKPKAPPAAAKPAAPQQKVVTLGDYKLMNKLGQGGMGSVFKAIQMNLDREVALKILSRELANKPAFVQRFTREAKVMAKLDHPNILRCYDVGEAGGYQYLAMEYVDGGSVEGWLKKVKRFSVGDALLIIISCAQGLQHAHELNMVHRDIKPDNILLTKKGIVKVADLGLAKAKDDDMSLTQTGTGAGTPLYMAPEQARDVKNVDARSDIFALGCMLYCLLAGEPPFKGETLIEVIEAKEKGRYTPLRKINDEVPERLELIIDKMLAKKAEHRYQDCAALVRELEGLGLANDRLSFIDGAAAVPKMGMSASSEKKLVATTPAPMSRSGPPGAPKTQGQEQAGYYYVALVTAEGQAIKRKVSTSQLEGLIRTKTVNAETEVSRSLDGSYRALGTYGEFIHLLKSNAITEKAEKKADKFRQIVDNIDKEVASRKRWKWFNDFMNNTGKMIGGAAWIFIVLALFAGGVFLFLKFFVLTPDEAPKDQKKSKKAAIEFRMPNHG